MDRVGDVLTHLKAAVKLNDKLCKGKFIVSHGGGAASGDALEGAFQVYAVTGGVGGGSGSSASLCAGLGGAGGGDVIGPGRAGR